MTAADLKHSLKTLGWSQTRLAEVLGVTNKTVSEWATGKTAVPKHVDAYLDLALKVQEFSIDCLPR